MDVHRKLGRAGLSQASLSTILLTIACVRCHCLWVVFLRPTWALHALQVIGAGDAPAAGSLRFALNELAVAAADGKAADGKAEGPATDGGGLVLLASASPLEALFEKAVWLASTADRRQEQAAAQGSSYSWDAFGRALLRGAGAAAGAAGPSMCEATLAAWRLNPFAQLEQRRLPVFAHLVGLDAPACALKARALAADPVALSFL